MQERAKNTRFNLKETYVKTVNSWVMYTTMLNALTIVAESFDVVDRNSDALTTTLQGAVETILHGVTPAHAISSMTVQSYEENLTPARKLTFLTFRLSLTRA